MSALSGIKVLELARVLAGSRAEPTDAAAVTTIARRAGFDIERDGNELTVLIPA